MSDEATIEVLRTLRREGKLTQQGLDGETARALLRTPPSALGHGQPKKLPALDVDPSRRGGQDNLADLVRALEGQCDSFQSALTDNTRVAKDHMGRSLLLLFEDTVRERLPEALQRSGRPTLNALRNTGFSKGIPPSKRPIDRGLDRRDHTSDIVLPDTLRDDIAKDILVIVDHELKRVFATVGGDIQKILQQVVQVKERVSKIEEEMLQRQVDWNMLNDQMTSLTASLRNIEDECGVLKDHASEKDRQMDILREQLGRRNEALDDTRVKFRKEVMRYKSRIYELQAEVDANGRRRGAGAAGVPSGSTAAASDRRQSTTALANQGGPPTEETQAEIFAATETAVKEATAKLQEEMRRAEVGFLREKKSLLQEMNLKLLERDAEIIKWKDKVRQMQLEMDRGSDNDD